MADEKIPPEVLRDLALAQGLRQAILVGWGTDGRTHVVTWGESIVDSLQAARGGNAVKAALGFPEAECRDASPRVRRALAYYAQAGEPWESLPLDEVRAMYDAWQAPVQGVAPASVAVAIALEAEATDTDQPK